MTLEEAYDLYLTKYNESARDSAKFSKLPALIAEQIRNLRDDKDAVDKLQAIHIVVYYQLMRKFDPNKADTKANVVQLASKHLALQNAPKPKGTIRGGDMQ